MGKHAILSPSGFKALMLCPAKPAMERGIPERSSDYADEGTAAHFLASECLAPTRGCEGDLYKGDRIDVWRHPESESEGVCWAEYAPTDPNVEHNVFEVDEEMVEAVQKYIDTVRFYAATGELLVEQALPIGHITGEEGAEGTADAVVLLDDEIVVIDLKYGRGVEVSVVGNPQLKLYALGALARYGMLGDFHYVRGVIVQPRVSDTASEDTWTVDELETWADDVATPAAVKSMELLVCDPPVVERHADPHPEACRFCRARATCKALSYSVEKAIEAEFTDLTTQSEVERVEIVKDLTAKVQNNGHLGAKMDAVELVEMWCTAIRSMVESELLAGKPVPGWKLVQGRKPPRKWSDTAAAEKTMKAMRLKVDEMYDRTLISPTSAEKLLKTQPKRWAKVQDLVTQGEGKPSVAPITDKRPALELAPIESEFQAIEEEVTA